MNRQWKKLFGLLLLACMLVGCNAPASANAPETDKPTNIVAPANALPSPTSPPPSIIPATPTSSPATPTLDPNAQIFKFDGINLALPASVARTATSKLVPAVGSNKNQPWLVAPQYLQITLAGYPAPKASYLTPEILVYPAQDYTAENSGARLSLQKLQSILSSPPAALTNDILPWLPYTPGEQSIAAQPRLLAFQGGNGLRVITQYDIFLDPTVTAPGDPIVNRLLFYHFEGVSSDGKYYIVAILPLNSALLANDPDPNASVPAGGIPYPGLGTDVAHFDYFKAITDLLNGANPDSFSPSLNALDELIGSLNVSP